MTRKHYVSLCKQVKQTVRQDKEEWLLKQESDLEYDLKHHNLYEFFRKLKNFDHVPIQPASVTLNEHGQKLLCTDDQLDRWKRHFASVLNVRRPIAIDSGMVVRSVGSGATLSEEEITNAIKKLKNNRASGNDGITAELLKAGSQRFDWLRASSTSLASGRVSQDWKDSVLVPVFKKNDRLICDNYRGISLLSVPGKVLANILLERLKQSVEPLLLEAQCGFRPGRGAIDQICGEKSSKFEVTTGVRQGCTMSPVLFNLVMDKIVCEALDKAKVGGVEIEYRKEGSL
ncbi:uncharacterized protein LOC134194353 [Corticium candelabrum]|uniref:uncharacterized protein LOC134194353 n=1 Tax=Corticium candelabrum TaxID=121492 RepID=UPI002E25D0EF|nr:uncharacterized protein LOC134194353 [Corticium candelabrum]